MEKTLKLMEKQTFKKINFNEAMERYLVFELTPEKKLLDIIRNLKDVFPRQKEWKNLTENKGQKELEILDKFRRKGKLYRKLCQNWMNKNMHLAEAFNEHFQDTEKEISTEEVIKFFDILKKNFKLGTKDIAVFVHVYLEGGLGMALFEDSANKLNSEIEKELR
jgi:hypothetical protein